MSLVNFPDKIDVTLGTAFYAGGNGLQQGNVISLYRNGDSWYEKSGSTTANTTDNRISMRPASPGGNIGNAIYLVPSDSNWTRIGQFDIVGNQGSYSFKQMWNACNDGTSPFSASSYWLTWNTPSSAFPTSFLVMWPNGFGTKLSYFNTAYIELFSAMEEGDDNSSSSSSSSSSDSSSGPHLIDKTTYVFI